MNKKFQSNRRQRPRLWDFEENANVNRAFSYYKRRHRVRQAYFNQLKVFSLMHVQVRFFLGCTYIRYDILVWEESMLRGHFRENIVFPLLHAVESPLEQLKTKTRDMRIKRWWVCERYTLKLECNIKERK